jgi:hypothetical protein
MTNDYMTMTEDMVLYHVNLKVSIACRAILRQDGDPKLISLAFLLRVSPEPQILQLSEGWFFVCSVIERSSFQGLFGRQKENPAMFDLSNEEVLYFLHFPNWLPRFRNF